MSQIITDVLWDATLSVFVASAARFLNKTSKGIVAKAAGGLQDILSQSSGPHPSTVFVWPLRGLQVENICTFQKGAEVTVDLF